jgi:hypothetical protein
MYLSFNKRFVMVHVRKKLTFLMLLVATAAGCKARSKSEVANSSGSKLDVAWSTNIPLVEISGSCAVPSNGGDTMYFVGDRLYTVATVQITGGSVSAVRDIDFSSELNSLNPSQWEAIACAADGTLFVLNENPGTVIVLDPETQKVLKVIHLSSDGQFPSTWDDDPNSKGEGLLVMGNGHIFVLKEKKIPLIIEFGPSGDQAEGLSSAMLTSPLQSDPFSEEKEEVFYPLRQWEFNDQAQARMVDFSDLASDRQGRVYVVSQESNVIGKVEGKLKVDEGKVDIRDFYDLPDIVKNPEGLTILSDDSVVVSTDRQSADKDNVFFFGTLAD